MATVSSLWLQYFLYNSVHFTDTHNFSVKPPNKPFQPTAPVGAFLTLAILTNAFPIYECRSHRGGG
jgi:hypothetical protein